MIENIITYLQFIFFRKKVKLAPREKEFTSFYNAKSVGIVCYVDELHEWELIQKIIAEFQANKATVNVFGIYTGKIIPSWCSNTIYVKLFSEKKYKLFPIPSGQYINDFIDTKFDLLINLSLSDKFLPLYISAVSKAKFKIAIESPKNMEHFDMFIKLENPEIEEYVDQLMHYLSKIKI